MFEERTYQPTPRRREQARQEGRSRRGTDLTAASVMLTATLVLLLAGPTIMGTLGSWFKTSIQSASHLSVSQDHLVDVSRRSILWCLWFVVPAVLFFWAVAVITQIGQVGWNWNPGQIIPKWERIDPSKGFARITGAKRWLDGALVVFRIATAVLIAVSALWLGRFGLVGDSADASINIEHVTGNAFTILAYAAAGLGAIALGEFGLRWWLFENSLKMTLEEAREEMREQEGDLRVRALRKGAHQELTRRDQTQKNDEG